MPPQKRPKSFSLFDTTSAPTSAKKITAPAPGRPTPAPSPTVSTTPAPTGTGMKQIKVDGVVYTVPAAATTPDQMAAEVDKQIARTAENNKPFTEQAGILPAFASEVAPMVEGLYNTVRHPIDTAVGMYEGVKGAPEAFMRELRNAPFSPMGALGNMLMRPTIDNAKARYDKNDLTGAATAMLTGPALQLFPAGKVGALMKRGGRTIAAARTGATLAEADELLKANRLKYGVGEGTRRVEGEIQDAAARARAATPADLNFPETPPPPPLPPDAPPPAKQLLTERSIFDDSPQPAAPAPAPTPTLPKDPPWAGKPVRDTLDYAEQQRSHGLSQALKNDVYRGDTLVTDPLKGSARARARAAEVIPPEAAAALAEIDRLMGQRTNLQYASRATPWPDGLLQGIGRGVTGTVKAASGPAAQRLYNFPGGPTSTALAAMQRAALLARLQGQDE